MRTSLLLLLLAGCGASGAPVADRAPREACVPSEWRFDVLREDVSAGWRPSIALGDTEPHLVAVGAFDESLGHSQLLWLTPGAGAETIGPANVLGGHTSAAWRGEPIVAYYGSPPREQGLHVATRGAGGWSVTTVDGDGDTGWSPSLAVDAEGGVHVAYRHHARETIHYAHRGPREERWALETVETEGGRGASVALAVGEPIQVAYADGLIVSHVLPETGLHLAERSGSGEWRASLVRAGMVGALSLARGADGRPELVFTQDEALHHGTIDEGRWSFTTLAPVAAEASALAIGGDGSAHAAFITSEGVGPRVLRYFVRPPGGDWRAERLTWGEHDLGEPCRMGQACVGPWLALAADDRGGVHLAFYSQRQLVLARRTFCPQP